MDWRAKGGTGALRSEAFFADYIYLYHICTNEFKVYIYFLTENFAQRNGPKMP